MLMIFPAAEVVVALQMDLADYRRRFNNLVIEERFGGNAQRELSEEECFTIIFGMVDDMMNKYLLWVPQRTGTPRTDEALAKLFTNWKSGDYAPYVDHLWANLLNEHFLRVEHWVDFAMKTPTWNVWSLHRLGGDIVFEMGEDYRVLDWTRKMESGEWSDPAYQTRRSEDEDSRTQKAVMRAIVEQERATADQILRLRGLPGLRHLDEHGIAVLRMVFSEQEKQILRRRRPSFHRLSIPTTHARPSVNLDSQQPKESVVEAIIADSTAGKKKRTVRG